MIDRPIDPDESIHIHLGDDREAFLAEQAYDVVRQEEVDAQGEAIWRLRNLIRDWDAMRAASGVHANSFNCALQIIEAAREVVK